MCVCAKHVQVQQNRRFTRDPAARQVVEGMKFDRGYISPYFVTDAKTMKAELDDPFILIAEKKISSCATHALPAYVLGFR